MRAPVRGQAPWRDARRRRLQGSGSRSARRATYAPSSGSPTGSVLAAAGGRLRPAPTAAIAVTDVPRTSTDRPAGPRQSPPRPLRRLPLPGDGRPRCPTGGTLVVAIPLNDVRRRSAGSSRVELLVGGRRARRARGRLRAWFLVGSGCARSRTSGTRPAPSPPATSPGGWSGRRAHRGGPARARAQRHARPDRGRLRRAAGVRGAAAPVRRRRLPRAAHAAHVDPGLRRAVPPGRRRAPRGPGRGHAPHRGRRPRAWACWSTTSCCSPASTRAGRWSASPSTSARSPPTPSTPRERSTPAARSMSPSRGGPLVTGDEGRLRQVVANLLGNAREHTPAGTPVHVRVRGDDEAPSSRSATRARVPGRGSRTGVRAVLPGRSSAFTADRRRRPGAVHRRRHRRGPRRQGDRGGGDDRRGWHRHTFVVRLPLVPPSTIATADPANPPGG